MCSTVCSGWRVFGLPANSNCLASSAKTETGDAGSSSPLVLGLVCGVFHYRWRPALRSHQWLWQVPHPTFPVSILASLSAGIGEEIMFRGFVFGLWGFILNWLFKRFNGRTVALSWIANVIAALAFGASISAPSSC
ncbi:CPBP family glutamic-type intramembrane protease [Candidatus Villigracilis affinis]|uniref:CPBP family glutamic-type intramembrane protease n=1 Tax=Candidatus Villigracilis affinis TaxID=3140682 RepID=UPI001D858313|nr:CPBP family intramembrane metalloprotease [Anaerolineales bacterium]